MNFNLPDLHYTLPNLKIPLFTDNAKVVYKPHSLAPGGIGTVKNHRRKAIKT